MSKFFVLLLFVLPLFGLGQQATNTDPSRNFVNVNIPKTPESAGFEKYGYAQVNEFTGTTNIAIPIYTFKSRFLQVPITLAYQASGIRVNQEASWVGLGFDLIAGGRITVETRGSVDFCQMTAGLSSTTMLNEMTKIFTRLGQHGENSVFTPATIWEPPSCNFFPCYPELFDGNAVSQMTQFGTAEPDIFRANFMGHSLTFYIDKITNQIKFIGEKSSFKINFTVNNNNNLTNWSFTDNSGIVYYFNQTESTTNTITGSAIVPETTTSAWLLTKILHPSGDYVDFTYSNYGYAVPAFSMSGSIVASGSTMPSVTIASETYQNVNLQSPYYLTRIESSALAADFVLEARSDLYGPGSRKLREIKLTEKLTNKIKRRTTFYYDYFQSSIDVNARAHFNSLLYNLPSPLSAAAYIAHSNLRLRLDSVSTHEDASVSPYRFYYNNSPTIPDKYSYSIDHWGFYNSVPNDQGNNYNFTRLIPRQGSCAVTMPPSPLSAMMGPDLLGFNRDCDPSSSKVMMLDSVVYPTGGSTKYTFEPHQSVMLPYINVTGGGLRVKQMRNYSESNLVGSKEYFYEGGKYMGRIGYYTNSNEIGYCPPSQPGIIGKFKYSTNGAVNDNQILLGYQKIRITEKGKENEHNG